MFCISLRYLKVITTPGTHKCAGASANDDQKPTEIRRIVRKRVAGVVNYSWIRACCKYRQSGVDWEGERAEVGDMIVRDANNRRVL